jgi:hypothetical protein
VKGVRQMAAAAVLADGRVLIAGGFSMPADDKGKPLLKNMLYARSSAILFDPRRFDARAYPWSITSPMRVPRYSHVMSALPGSNAVVSAGGWTDDDPTASVEVYDARLQTWGSASSMPAIENTQLAASTPFGCSATLPDGRLLIAGGEIDLRTNETSRRSVLYRP